MNTLKYDAATSDSVMPQFLIATKNLVDEVLHILLFVLRDNCGDGLKISKDSENLLVNRLVEAQPSSKVCLTHVLNSSRS